MSYKNPDLRGSQASLASVFRAELEESLLASQRRIFGKEAPAYISNYWPLKSPLNELIAPMDPVKFRNEIHQRKFHHFKTKSSSRFDKYLSLEKLIALLRNPKLEPVETQFSDDHHQLAPLPDDREKWVEMLKSGKYSLRIYRLDKVDPEINALAREFDQFAPSPLRIHCFYTPPGKSTLKWHFDREDLFIFQTYGRKTWRIYEPGFRRPLQSQQSDFWPAFNERTAKLHKTALISPGEMFHIPAGYPHVAQADQKTGSLHFGVGISHIAVHDLVAEILFRRLLEMTESPKFRSTAFVSGPKDRKQRDRLVTAAWKRLTQSLRPHELDMAYDRKHSSMQTLNLESIEAANRAETWASALNENTVLAKTRERFFVTRGRARAKGKTEFVFRGTVIPFPAGYYEIFERIQKLDSFRLSDLPGKLNKAEKRELIVRLMKIGAVSLVID